MIETKLTTNNEEEEEEAHNKYDENNTISLEELAEQASSGHEDTTDYSFCIFRIPEVGGRVLWEITNSCNYSCKYCIFAAQHGAIDGELETEEVFDVLEGLKGRNFTHIKFTGGEPFKRKDMIQILRKARDLGFEVDISTNASLITEEMAQEISELGLKMVHVSVDGQDKYTHELARGRNTYDPTIRGLRYLTETDTYVRVGTVVFKGNEDHLDEVVESIAGLGADEVIFSYMEAAGRMKDDYSIVSETPMDDLKTRLEDVAKKYEDKIKVNYSFTEHTDVSNHGCCPGGDKFLYIDNLGRASPCTWVVEDHPEYRSVKTFKDSGFEEVMESEPLKAYRELAKKHCKNCGGCPVRRR